MNKNEYEVPMIEIVEVQVEKGFAVSNTNSINGFDDNGGINDVTGLASE